MTIKNKLVILISLAFIVLATVYFYFMFLAFDLDQELRYQISKFKYPKCEFIALGHNVRFKNDQYAGNGFWDCKSEKDGIFTATNSKRSLLITINSVVEDVNLNNCANESESINSNLVDLWYCSESEKYGDSGKGYVYLSDNKKNNDELLYITVDKAGSLDSGINGVDSAVVVDFLGDIYVDGNSTKALEFRPRFTNYQSE